MSDQKSTDRKIAQTPSTSLKPEKKKWKKPQLARLDIMDTKGGDWNYETEGSFWFLTWGPPS